MKLKKMLLAGLLSASVFSAVGCNNNNNSSSEPIVYDQTVYTEGGNRRLAADPDTSVVDSFIDLVISQGGELVTGGISTYAKFVVLNLLKECGIDLRDATTKTLEKIQQQLDQIEARIKALAERSETIHAEDVFSDLLKELANAQNVYIPLAVYSLGDLVDMENDDSYTEEEVEEVRQAFYNNTVKDLKINGSPLATYVTTLAGHILQPNPADTSKDILYYYTLTLGTPDKWSIQRYKNVRNFLAYVDSTLVQCANLAKYQMYYLALGKDRATLAAYEKIMDEMAKAVNLVNQKCLNINNSLKDIEDKMKNSINIYLPTNTEYSTRMATLTYNHNDVEGNDSRQALLMSYVNDSGRHGNHQVAYSLEPGEVTGRVMNDFNDYSKAYCSSSYTLHDYLTYAGFYANNKDLYDKALGIYNGQWYVDQYGWLHDDKDYSFTYYNDQGNLVRKNAYQVASYHNWIGTVTRTELRYLDDQYYLCFARPYGNSQKLDGYYKEVYMSDDKFTVMESCFFAPHYYSFIGDKPWPLHDCW